jgi:hypothetical protein
VSDFSDWFGEKIGLKALWAALVGVLTPIFLFLVSSETLRYFMQGGAILGAVVAYGTVHLTGKELEDGARLLRAWLSLGAFLVCVAAGMVVLWVLRPETAAAHHGFLEHAREVLESANYLHPANWVEAVITAAGAFSLVYALCMFFPQTDK